MMPIARSRWGRLASSAWVDIESNPIYAKKIRPAPSATPSQPLSSCKKGRQFAGST